MEMANNLFMQSVDDECSRLKVTKNLIEQAGELKTEYLQGTIEKRTTKDGTIYYHTRSVGPRNNRTIKSERLGTADSPEVETFIKTRVLSRLKSLVDENEKSISKLASSYKDYSMKEIAKALPRNCRELVETTANYLFLIPNNHFSEDEGDNNNLTRASARGDFNNKNPMEIMKPHRTITGEVVRSKGEALIYDLLVLEDIPFKYECKLVLDVDGGKRVFYPDFTIPCTDGTNLYIEYSGMIDDAMYIGRMVEKLRAFHQNGITISQSLFLIFDDINGCIDMEMISDTVKGVIRKRIERDRRA